MSGFVRKLFLSVCVSAMLPTLCGCNIFGFLSSTANGPDDVPAKYVPKKESMLVLAESYGAAPSADIDSQYLSYSLTKNLKDHDIAPTIDPKVLVGLRDANGDEYNKMTITAIGRAAGAKQVLYVQITNAQLEQPNGSDQVRGVMSAKVRIVDCDSGETRWPAGSRTGAVVKIQTDWARTSTPQTKIHDKMSDDLAEAIGKLFHSYTPDHFTDTSKLAQQ
jgi:hypothetical protein